MAINSLDSVRVPSLNFQVEQVQQKKSDQVQNDTEQVQRREDTLEISAESRKIISTQLTERLQQVQQQANAGYYNNPDIIRQAAARISQTFKDANDEQVEAVTGA
ncbi:MAG: hypothetical protein U0264_12100 [Candidatus Kapaibacterium sp.]